MRESYGQLYPRFWDGPTGQAIQRKGKDAVILAAFLMSNRWANMIGLYELPIEMMLRSLPVLTKRSALHRGVVQLSEPDCNYAYYDQISGVVWVREMARFRLQLAPFECLHPSDKRVAHVVRAYEGVKPNAFLARFYDRYARTLNLPRERRAFDAPSEAPPEGPCKGPSQAPTKGLVSPMQASDQDQDQVLQEQPPAAPAATRPVENLWKPDGPLRMAKAPAEDGNYRVIARIARDILQRQGALEEGDLIEAVKTACAQAHIAYSPPLAEHDVVPRACASELFKFRRPDIAGRAAP